MADQTDSPSGAPAAIAWLDPAHADAAVAAIRRAGLALAGVGSPARGQTGPLADTHGVPPLQDLRAALASSDARLALIDAAPAPLDARAVSDAERRGLRIVTTRPFAASLAELAETGLLRQQAGARTVDAVHLVPRLRAHPAFRAAAEVLETFGRFQLVTIESTHPPAAGGFTPALFAAIEAALTLVGPPELIDATGARPGSTDTPHLAALLRFPDGRAGQLAVTEAGAWSWRLTLHGPEGRLTIRPSGFDWHGPDGDKRDEHRAEADSSDYHAVLAASLAALTDPGGRRDPAPDWVSLHSTADAALLSARTGQAESPATIVRATMSSAG